MTGLTPETDRIVEVCIERVRGDAIEDRLHTFVRPETMTVDGKVGNAHVHGIVSEALQGAPSFATLAPRIASLLDGAVVIAHGAFWDVAFLTAEFARAHFTHAIPFYVDTLNLSRRTFDLPRHSLDSLRAHFGIDASRAHRADADVAALREVWKRCIGTLNPKTPRDVWQVRVAHGQAREQIIADCKDAAASGKAVTVLYRPRGRAPEPMVMMLTDVVLGLDPPRVIGYQLPQRGRRELRADRILRIEKTEGNS